MNRTENKDINSYWVFFYYRYTSKKLAELQRKTEIEVTISALDKNFGLSVRKFKKSEYSWRNTISWISFASDILNQYKPICCCPEFFEIQM